MTAHTVLQPIAETLQAFQRDHSEIDQLIEGLFDELDRMRVDVSEKLRELDDERRRVVDQEEALANQGGEVAKLSELIESKDAELAETKNALSETRQELERIRADSSEADLRGDLESVNSEFTDAQEQLREAAATIERLQAQLEQEVSVDVEEVTNLTTERDTLLEELELVRARAAELDEAVSEQELDFSEERDRLENELAELRELVDSAQIHDKEEDEEPARPRRESRARRSSSRSSSKRESSRRESSRRESSRRETARPEATQPVRDAVVDSVVAQFAKLQKDVASRRKTKR